jgi:hypothetical protein
MVNLGPAGDAALAEAKFAGKTAAEAAEEVARIARIAGKSVDEVFDAVRLAGKMDDVAINAAKEFKASSSLLSSIKGTASAAAASSKKAIQEGISTTGDYAKKAADLCGKNKAWCAGGVLASAAGIYAADKYLKVKNYKGKITKIEPYVDGGLPIIGGGTNVAKVTYSEAIDILMSDAITFSGTNCQPSIDGEKSPYKIASKTEVWIKIDDGALSAAGNKGDFSITTGVLERLGEAVGAGAGAAGAAAGTAAGAAAGGAAQGLGAGGSALLKSFTSGAGLWLTLALCCLCFAFIIFKFIL